ncbi:conserved Plasmodium protein, unknown function [Plasmodium ovale]|uniref:Uncharacterized protein n=1 Tax=Plasmodium ovale TaxID=36330 RepID=A0A1C3KM66_PLAOA|nr:conserved Plasmodium protein, unknown function [Plasmodium ovale]
MQAQQPNLVKTRVLNAVSNALSVCVHESRNICPTNYKQMTYYGLLIFCISFILGYYMERRKCMYKIKQCGYF